MPTPPYLQHTPLGRANVYLRLDFINSQTNRALATLLLLCRPNYILNLPPSLAIICSVPFSHPLIPSLPRSYPLSLSLSHTLALDLPLSSTVSSSPQTGQKGQTRSRDRIQAVVGLSTSSRPTAVWEALDKWGHTGWFVRCIFSRQLGQFPRFYVPGHSITHRISDRKSVV